MLLEEERPPAIFSGWSKSVQGITWKGVGSAAKHDFEKREWQPKVSCLSPTRCPTAIQSSVYFRIASARALLFHQRHDAHFNFYFAAMGFTGVHGAI